jgi:hypothetical protein
MTSLPSDEARSFGWISCDLDLNCPTTTSDSSEMNGVTVAWGAEFRRHFR